MVLTGAAWRQVLRSPFLWLAGWLLVVVLGLVLWWGQLERSYAHDRQAATQEAAQLATQMANALLGQANAVFGLLDYATRAFAEAWTEGVAPALATAVRRLNGGIPGDPWLAVRVIDENGIVVYELERLPLMSFQAGEPQPLVAWHASQPEPTLHLGALIAHPQQQRWALPLSFPLLRGPAFAGVIEVMVAPEFLSQGLRTAFPGPSNVATFTDTQGRYLARSQALQLALGQRLPPDSPVLAPNAERRGQFQRFATMDGIERFYAWQRLPDYPVIVIAGIDRQFTAGSVEAAIAASRQANLVGSVAVVIAALFLAALVGQRQRAWRQQQTHNERLALALRGADLGWWDLNFLTRQVHFNEQWAHLLGYQHHDLPTTTDTYVNWIHPDDRAAMRAAFVAHLRGQTPRFQAEYRVRHANGHWLWVLDRGQVLRRGPHGRALRAAGTLLDISARKAAETALTVMASTDSLTGLANRRAFLNVLETLPAAAPAAPGPGVLMLLDIDHFKQVNDTWGHAAGDRAMQHLAQLLRHGLRQPDIAARLGGEEFAVLIPGLQAEDGLRLAERLRQRIATTPVPGLPQLQLTVSIGVAELEPGKAEQNLQRADEAMYTAKRTGRNRVCLWPPSAVPATA